MRLRVNGTGPSGEGYRVWLDDIEQEKITDLALTMGVGRFTRVTITYYVEAVDLDVEAEQSGAPGSPQWGAECEEFGCHDEQESGKP